MKVILRKDIEKVGALGDLVMVKDGFARNYLLPRNLAVTANPAQKNRWLHEKRILEKKKEQLSLDMKKLAARIEKLEIVIPKQVGEESRIFGSVTTSEIASLIKNHGIEISKKQILLPKDLKKTGSYEAEIRLYGNTQINTDTFYGRQRKLIDSL